ncbi:MAG: hypothetical protein O3C40_12425 [Planctomycetota bacterium]|nr:hypothetical protein [Planctomycetota bacterium]
MLCRLVGVATVVLAFAGQSLGFEVGAVIRKIDADKRVAVVFANGQERTVKIAAAVKIQDENGKDLSGGLAAEQLKEGATVTLNVERDGNTPAIVSIRLGGKVNAPNRPNAPGQASVGKSSVGFKPLTEMTVEDRYKDEDGGLYGGGRNELPESLSAAAEKVTAKIQPLDAEGNPAADGKIALVSISMSNATQEFSRFKQLADADEQKSPLVSVVDCAQGGQTMARWADPQAACWTEADRRLKAHGVSHDQVQVAWVKLANAGPSGDLDEHGKQLERDTRIVLANLTEHFPNLRIAYLGSRIYGGWADGRLNPEPYAYEGAFVVRWLIQSQIKADADLNYDADLGEVKSPLLLWGPYFWADGVTPRKSDGLIWERSDLVGDGTHPSNTGRQKVAEQLLNFFKTDAPARTWFVRDSN